VRWSGAHWGAGWWCHNPPTPIRRSAPALLPLDDHHDSDLDSKCTRPRGRAAALRLP